MKRKRKSFLTCKHEHTDGYTGHCPDCGYNEYMTEDEYLKRLCEEANVSIHDSVAKIDILEKRLGIVR
jgi:hypothetical protein